MKINIVVLIVGLLIQAKSNAQQNYCDFELNKVVSFGMSTGKLDTNFINPSPSSVNSSGHCAAYIRDTVNYDFIRIYTSNKMTDVTPYASNAFSTPKLKLKVFSKAPVGTMIHLQLGLRNVDNYPAGVHSEYLAITAQQNTWETLTFNYFQSPSGSMAAANDIDKLVILFHPNSQVRDTFYFDDIVGPDLLNTTSVKNGENLFTGIQTIQPNPSKENVLFNFQISKPDCVSLKLYNLTGNSETIINNQRMDVGPHNIFFDTTELPSGIYFCEFKCDVINQIRKIVISH